MSDSMFRRQSDGSLTPVTRDQVVSLLETTPGVVLLRPDPGASWWEAVTGAAGQVSADHGFVIASARALPGAAKYESAVLQCSYMVYVAADRKIHKLPPSYASQVPVSAVYELVPYGLLASGDNAWHRDDTRDEFWPPRYCVWVRDGDAYLQELAPGLNPWEFMRESGRRQSVLSRTGRLDLPAGLDGRVLTAALPGRPIAELVDTMFVTSYRDAAFFIRHHGAHEPRLQILPGAFGYSRNWCAEPIDVELFLVAQLASSEIQRLGDYRPAAFLTPTGAYGWVGLTSTYQAPGRLCEIPQSGEGSSWVTAVDSRGASVVSAPRGYSDDRARQLFDYLQTGRAPTGCTVYHQRSDTAPAPGLASGAGLSGPRVRRVVLNKPGGSDVRTDD